ncbi:extracellular solute-binding protein [Paenibacillus dakarensis]|uniref:extracellular solute-binding protein n=1 Tax=Paenibacillus dakarensis TaxID=1527293 RepID=UPI0006D561B9|nr:extracellular solute-binding protein [Paenibacillus dakarensis]
MKITKSIALLTVTALLMVSVMAGCGKGGGEGKPTPSVSGEETNKPVTLKMMTVQHSAWPYKADWPIYRYIKEKTNIDFKVQVPSSDYNTALNLAISSNEMPDIMITTSLNNANTNGKSGAFVNFFDHLDQMPNYKKFLDEHPELKAFVLSPEGKSYYLPHYGLEQQSRRSWLYRDDIFKKHNLTPPADWDEMYTTAKKLKELYPESHPVLIYDNLSSLNNIAPAFNTWFGNYIDYEKNEWRYGPIEDGFKEMLMTLNKFYKDGLIPPDFMALKRPQFNDLLAQNKSFIANDYIGLIDELPVLLKKSPEEFSLDYMVPAKGGKDGKPYNAYGGYLGNGFAVASNSKNKDAALRYLDFLYSPEGIDMATWGKEGETYTVENGVRKFKPEFEGMGDLRTKTGIATYGAHTVVDMTAYDPMNSEKLNKALKQIQQGNEAKLQPRLAFTDEENEVLNLTNTAIKKYMDEQVSKFILGQKSFDEWDAYVEEIKKMGIDEVVAVHKSAYERAQQFLK